MKKPIRLAHFYSLLWSIALLPFIASADWQVKADPKTSVLVGFDQEWRLHDTGEAPAAAWTSNSFDDSSWQETKPVVSYRAVLDRYGFEEPGTQLQPGGRTAYLRTRFTMPGDIDEDSRLILDFIAKDGAVFYLNGHEIGRTPSMPHGPISHESEAISAPRLRLKTGFHIDKTHLRPGENVLAASLHSFPDEENTDQRALAVELTLVEGWSRRPLTAEPRHVRVTWVEEPQHQAVVSWTTDLPGDQHRLYLDDQPRRGKITDYAQSFTPTRSGEFSLTRTDIEWSARPSHFHHVHLDDLRPDTTYFLTVVNAEEKSREFHFRTAPDDDRPIKMLFGGDSRIAGNEPYFHQDRRAINRRMAGLFEGHPEILGLIHGGDYTQLAQWRFFDPYLTDYELTTTQDGRLLPIIPARGNHDRDIGFEEVFWWPEQSGRYYYLTRLTPRVQLVTLNTEISLGGNQRRWLARTLETSRPESRWLLASYHRPSWPSVRGFADGANRRQFWVPHFENFRVDLVLESHDHALKRTVPILNHAQHPEGVVYIGDGGAGVPQRNPDTTRWYLQPPGMAMSVHHVHLLEFETDVLRGTAYSIGGEILDEFERLPREGIAYFAAETTAETAASNP